MSDCRKCFRTSRLYTLCTLLELFTWAEEMAMAVAARKVLLNNEPYFAKDARAWRQANQSHPVRLQNHHLLMIGQAAVRDNSDDPQVHARAMAFCRRLLPEFAKPFACWPRILVNLATQEVTERGFTLTQDGELGYWQPDWPGFPETRGRKLTDGMYLGCPNSMTSLTPLLRAALLRDTAFQKAFWDGHQQQIREALGGPRLGDLMDISAVEYTVLADVITADELDPRSECLLPVAAEMVEVFLARADQSGLN